MYFANWLKLVGNDSFLRNEFDDIFSDIIIKIWSLNIEFKKFKEANLYVNKALKNKSVDLFKKHKNIKFISVDTVSNLVHVNNNIDYINLIWGDRDFKKTEVYKAAYLRYNTGLKYIEIAKYLNITLNNVKSKLLQFRNNALPKLTVKYELN